MEQIQLYIILFGIIVLVGQLFQKSSIPIALLLVITGMLLSLVPWFPPVTLNPAMVLNVFLPLLVYQISSFSSWTDFKKNLRPIAMLSVGHVIFIMLIVAVIVHLIIPEFSWPLAFVLGAVIAPPDDVAIVSIAEKVHLPWRLLAILQGEGMMNDAAALTLFKFSLAAVITHQFFMMDSIFLFLAVIIGEIFYGVVLGNVLGKLRLRIKNPMLHIIASFITPFIAYLPAAMLGGSGIIATAITGFIIGQKYAELFTPEYRLVSRSIWPALSFGIESLLYLLLGLDMRAILERISSITPAHLALYSTAVILTVIIGRFIWVYLFVLYLPRILFPFINKKDPYPPWQYPFLISWSGMRGVISLAAALAIPALPSIGAATNPRDLLIFLVFVVIAATLLVQGATLPWLIKKIGVTKHAELEKYQQHILELQVRLKMTKAVLRWLSDYKWEIKDDPELLDAVKVYIREYRMIKKQLKEQIGSHDENAVHDEQKEAREEASLLSQIIEVERSELLRLWHNEKIPRSIRDKLLERLDHSAKHLPE